MTTLRIGVRTHEEAKARLLAIARGQARREPNEPTIWVASLASLAQVLSQENLTLLRLIAERKPSSLTELADMTGRAVSNLSRTLATMERYGMVKMVEGDGRAKAPRLACDHVEIVMPPLANDMEAA
ncbi:MAG TPA: helix-turn-helix domain-containing protein [Rhodospirillaceae bacterium]|nr:helix-turn-helix domain-containing protein [Rhodospirillaceae bacterium]